MAKRTIKLVSIYAHRNDRKAVLERVQRLGVVDIETTLLDEETSACPEGFSRPDMEGKATAFERSAATVQQALSILDEVAPDSRGLMGMFSGRREIDEQEFESAAAQSQAGLQIGYDILELQKQRAECAAEIVRTRALLAQLEPWKALDVPPGATGTRTTAVFIGTLPMAYTPESLAEAVAARDTQLVFDCEIIGAAQEQTCIALFCPREQSEAAEQVLRTLSFSRPSLPPDKLPCDMIEQGVQRMAELETQQKQLADALQSLGDQRRALELTADYYTARAEKYRTIGQLRHSRHTFLLTGYIAETDVPRLTQALEDLTVALEVADADPEKAPVQLVNNAFAAPAESITAMYALPLASEVDPTPVMSFFYYLFFGMMLSDAGYGLLMVIGCWLLLKKGNPEAGMRRNLKLFLYCGISTTFWGFMFGSFFGDAITVISRTFFGHEVVLRPLLFDPITNALPMLILSLGLGLVQILVGIGVKFYMLWKAGDRLGACFDCGFWMTLLVGLAVLAVGVAAVPALTTVGAVVAIASAAGLVLTQGRKKKGVMKVFGGLASLYDSTGYLSDLMSYSRLMALGLTTGVMSSVFNMLGAMFGRGILGALVMLIVFVLGHGINFGINALGAYVHSLRLQYVEMFGKFYEGGGRPFQPFAIHSKYIRIKEETKK